MSKIEVKDEWINEVQRIDLLKGIGYVEIHDFSKANSSEEARIYFISKVASVCYSNPNAIGSINLYNRLSRESVGLPSSSFEFIPVLLNTNDMDKIMGLIEAIDYTPNVLKYGEILIIKNEQYLLTNLRALMNDIGEHAKNGFFNNDPEEIKIIKKYFKVFLKEIDLNTRSQFVRHRTSLQELSRRYVSGKKEPFTFYISDKMKDIVSDPLYSNPKDEKNTTQYLIDECVNHYNAAIKDGVKPEEARRILPQAMMTKIWSAWQPAYLTNFFKLRLDSHAQSEIQELARNMHQLVMPQDTTDIEKLIKKGYIRKSYSMCGGYNVRDRWIHGEKECSGYYN